MIKTLLVGFAITCAAFSAADIHFVNNPYTNSSPDYHYHAVIDNGGHIYSPLNDASQFNGSYSAGSNEITVSASERQVVSFDQSVNSNFGILDLYNVYFYSTADILVTNITITAPSVEFGNLTYGAFQGDPGMASSFYFGAELTTQPNITGGVGLGSADFSAPTYGDFRSGGQWSGANAIPSGNSFLCLANTVYTAQLSVGTQLDKTVTGGYDSTYYSLANGSSVFGDPTAPVSATFTYQAVPEPSAFLVVGMVPLLMIRRRRKTI